MADDRKSKKAELQRRIDELVEAQRAVRSELIAIEHAEQAEREAEWQRKRAIDEAAELERTRTQLLAKYGSWEAAALALCKEWRDHVCDPGY